MFLVDDITDGDSGASNSTLFDYGCDFPRQGGLFIASFLGALHGIPKDAVGAMPKACRKHGVLWRELHMPLFLV